jgi:hypothetical protein
MPNQGGKEMKKLFVLFILGVCILALSGCNKKYLEMQELVVHDDKGNTYLISNFVMVTTWRFYKQYTDISGKTHWVEVGSEYIP